MATTLVRFGVGLEEVTPVRNPQDALARYAERTKQVYDSRLNGRGGLPTVG